MGIFQRFGVSRFQVKPKKTSIMSTEYDYEDGDYEGDDYLYPDRHSPQAVVPVSTTPAPHMKGSPIRMWKVCQLCLRQ